MPRRRDPSDLLPPDFHLWERVRATVIPRQPSPVDPVLADPPPQPTMSSLLDSPLAPHSFPMPMTPVMHPLDWRDDAIMPRMDKKRIKQGHIRPTAHLDLHGLTVARAEQQLHQFLTHSQRQGHAWVEIITGHGRFKQDDPTREIGVLKRLLPQWLNHPAQRSRIKRVIPAPKSRGGAVWVALVTGD